MKKNEETRTGRKVRREMKDLLSHIEQTARIAKRILDDTDSNDDAANYISKDLDEIHEARIEIDRLVAELADFPEGLDDEMRRLGRYPTTDANGRKRYVSVPE